jgi:toxin YoeB
VLLIWTEQAWEDFFVWQIQNDRKTILKINELIKDISRNGLSQGIGHPEPLKQRKAWSRHIDHGNRFVYNFDEKQNLIIFSCKGHYD